MKKILRFSLIVSLVLFIISCNENSASTNDAQESNTSFQTDTVKSVKFQEKSREIIDPNAPPKYANKAIVVEMLIAKCNNPKAPLTEEQINQINERADGMKVTTFKNQHSCSMFQRRMAQYIKSKVLTPEQLSLYPRRKSKRKNNVKR